MPEPTGAELDERLQKLRVQGDERVRLPAVVEGDNTQAEKPPRSTAISAVWDPVRRLDERIVEASAAEARELLDVRERLAAQQELLEDRRHIRRAELMSFYAKIGLSVTAFAGGAALIVGGFALPGFVCVGAGLYAIAPSFIDRVTDRIFGKGDP